MIELKFIGNSGKFIPTFWLYEDNNEYVWGPEGLSVHYNMESILKLLFLKKIKYEIIKHDIWADNIKITLKKDQINTFIEIIEMSLNCTMVFNKGLEL